MSGQLTSTWCLCTCASWLCSHSGPSQINRGMPRDLETIADHMALLSQSSLFNDGKFQFVKDALNPTENPTNNLSPVSIGNKVKAWVSSKKKSNIDFIASLPSSLHQIRKGGWRRCFGRLHKTTLIGPPALVDSVTEKMKTWNIESTRPN